jgi:tetratricopeptide (TPR) repeat protein
MMRDIAALERSWANALTGLTAGEAARRLASSLAGPAPYDVVAMRRLAKLATSAQPRQNLLTRALELAPDYAEAHLDLAITLFSQRRNAEALPHFRFLAERTPENAVFGASLAVCYGHIGNYQKAIDLYESCRDKFSQDVTFHINYAEALKYAGRAGESVALLRGALAHKPGSGQAWWALANIKTEIFSRQDIQTMLAQMADTSMSMVDRYHMHYALGRAFEQVADYAQSFQHYAEGAGLKRAEISYNERDTLEMAQRSRQFFTASRLAGTRGLSDAAPIFILGMPRAGSTLVEQILASHSRVEGTMELPEIAYIVGDMCKKQPDTPYPDMLAGYDEAALAALGQRYIDNTRIYRKTGKPYFIDKMPANCMHVGLIHMILPNAKIIDVRRDAMANCFAAFKQLFGQGVLYSYGFEELARYNAIYLETMAHVEQALPGRVHRIHYEKLVNDTEAEIRRLLAYCGLEFEPACLRFWESDRAVSTPSAEQVRRPIFHDGLEAWRHYEPWLGPLSRALMAPFSVASDPPFQPPPSTNTHHT